MALALAPLTLLALEGLARLLPQPPGSDLARLHRYSEVYGWEPRPGTQLPAEGVSINPAGYRGREVDRTPSPNAARVLVLGDSIAFGIGVSDDETFASLLDSQPGLEAVNLAVEGYGPGQSLLRLEHAGLAFRPALVLMNLCLDNDFADAMLPRFLYDGVHPKPFFRIDAGRLVLEDAHLRLGTRGRLGLAIRERSRLVELLGRIAAGEPATAAEHWLDCKQRALADPDAAVGLVTAILSRMRDESEAAGAGFLVAIHPDEMGYRRHSPWINALARAAEPAGLRLVDMRQRYRARGLRFSDISLDAVGHLSPRGHREAAAILGEELLARTP
jgi:GDSL-like Lipase/Acylhydrolase family